MNLFSKRKAARQVKNLFDLVMMPEKKELDPGWVENNFHIIKDMFMQGIEVGIIEDSDKSHNFYSGIIKRMRLNGQSLRIDSRNFVVEFWNPSHYTLGTGKGVGNIYFLDITSQKNAPSKLKLFYECI